MTPFLKLLACSILLAGTSAIAVTLIVELDGRRSSTMTLAYSWNGTGYAVTTTQPIVVEITARIPATNITGTAIAEAQRTFQLQHSMTLLVVTQRLATAVSNYVQNTYSKSVSPKFVRVR